MDEGTSLLSTVQSLRDKLSADPPPSLPRVLRTLQKLKALPISIDVLHETGIGKVVNGFRKSEGDVADTARSLVRAWKALVKEAMDKEEAARQGATEATGHQHRPEGLAAGQGSSPRPPANKAALESPARTVGKPQPQSPSHSPSVTTAAKKKKPHSPARPEKPTKSPSSKSSSLPSPLRASKGSPSVPQSSKVPKPPPPGLDSLKPREGLALPKKKPSSSESRTQSERPPASAPSSGSGKVRPSTEGRPGDPAERNKKVTKPKAPPPPRGESSTRPSPKEHPVSSQDRGKASPAKRPNTDKDSTPHPVKKKPAAPSSSALNGSTDPAKLTPPSKKSPKVTLASSSSASPSSGSLSREKPVKKSAPSSSGKKSDKRTPSAKPPPAKKTPPSDLPAPSKDEDGSSDDDNDTETKNFHNTGMSFGACLLGPASTKPKKVTKVKPNLKSKPPSKKGSSSHAASPGKPPLKGSSSGSRAPSKSSEAGSKVRGQPSDAKAPKVRTDGPRTAGRSEADGLRAARPPEATSSESGQGSDGGQVSDGGRRQRKKRSMSEEEEQLIMNAKKVRRESTEVSLALPEIQPNYKPMRLPEINSPLKKRSLTPEEEMAYLGSKQGRTKVFSGRIRVNRLSSVPRLYDICMEILCDNIDALDEVGGVPYDILLPVLQRCTPEQLFHLEDCNPHLLEDSDSLWEKHVEKDFRGRRPTEMESWRELYIREHDARDARLKSITANISAQMAAKDPGRLTKMAFMDRPAKPPRNVVRQQQRHGTASGNFAAEKRPHSSIQPHRPPATVAMDTGRAGSQQQRQAKQTKVVAPMMMKTLKMIKKLRR